VGDRHASCAAKVDLPMPGFRDKNAHVTDREHPINEPVPARPSLACIWPTVCRPLLLCAGCGIGGFGTPSGHRRMPTAFSRGFEYARSTLSAMFWSLRDRMAVGISKPKSAIRRDALGLRLVGLSRVADQPPRRIVPRALVHARAAASSASPATHHRERWRRCPRASEASREGRSASGVGSTIHSYAWPSIAEGAATT